VILRKGGGEAPATPGPVESPSQAHVDPNQCLYALLVLQFKIETSIKLLDPAFSRGTAFGIRLPDFALGPWPPLILQMSEKDTRNHQTQRKDHLMGACIGTAEKWIAGAFFLAVLFVSAVAHAGWNAQPETIAQHPTWIYTPDSTLSSDDKRGLMVVLHGCAQTHNQIKNGGTLEEAADDFGLVLAIPYVTQLDGYFLDCWDYDKGVADDHGHLAEIIDLAKELTSRAGLNIDPYHVYVVGLSSGGALALKLGCKAPEVFAGIGAIAGPSVGSAQWQATAEGYSIPGNNVSNAITTCRSLAAASSSAFDSQIATVAYGDMDKDGPKQIIEMLPCRQSHPGQNCVVSTRWSEDNIRILREIYDLGALGPEKSVQNGKGTEQSVMVNENAVLGLLVIHDVGHAWPAGSGRDNSAEHGQYIAQQGLNYARYAARWLTENNRRVDAPPYGPLVTCVDPRVSGTSVTLECSASGPNPISSYHVVLSGSSPKDDTLPGAPSFTQQYDDLADGSYTVTVTATDSQGNESTTVSLEFEVSSGLTCVTADNASHVAQGRADACGWFGFWACAKGSSDLLGLNFSFFTSSVKQTGPDYWVEVDDCPAE